MSRLVLPLFLAATLHLVASQGLLQCNKYPNWNTLTLTLFDTIDKDKSGILTEFDFIELSSHHIATLTLTGPETKWVRDNYMEIWNRFHLANFFRDIPRGDFPNVFKNVGLLGLNCQLAVQIIYTRIDNIADVNANGVVTKDEFINFYTVFNLPAGLAEQAFDKLDKNHDGFLYWDELFDALKQWYSNVDHPTTGFIGWVLNFMP